MASDGEIVINTKIDTNGIDKGLKKLKNNLDETAQAVENYTQKSNAQLDKTLKKIEIEAKLKGKNVDAQEKYNAVLKSYIELMTETNGVIKKGSEVEKQRYNQLQAARAEVEKQDKATKDYAGTLSKFGVVAGTVTAATKKILEGVREVTEAYKVQSKAEQALQTAAQNNPFLDVGAVENLKAYASELQSITNYGDEFTLQFMTRLAAAGRTQDEIQRIIKASADIAASGAMSFESAVMNLNKTFSGLAGELGESVPAIRALTQEELKQGKAIDVLAKQYAGMAESLADTRVQAENARGDLKEAIGELTAPAANAWDSFWLSFYNKGIEIINAVNDKLEEVGGQVNFNEINKLTHTLYTNKETGATYGGERKLTDEQLSYWVNYFENEYKKKINGQLAYFGEVEQETLQFLQDELRRRQRIVKEQEEQTKAAEKQAKAQEEINKKVKEEEDINARAAALKVQSNRTLEAQLTRMELKAELTGEEIDEQEKLNAMIDNYIDLIVTANGLISENNEASKEKLENIKQQIKKVGELSEAEEAAQRLQEERDKLKIKKEGITQRYEEEREALKAQRDYWNNVEIEDEQERTDAIEAIHKKEFENRAKYADDIAGLTIDYTQRINDVISSSAQLMTQSNQLNTQRQLSDLDKQHKKGIINEEEYEKKKLEIQRKGANEQYKIDMFNWTSSLLVATANIAQGVTKAIAQGFPIGIINGAILAAAGGVQLASIIASKPVKPAFERGGIVGGNSYTGDNIEARVNSGEMILTRSQQKALFNMANGKSEAAAGPQIVINNNAANMVSATAAQIDTNKIGIMIDAHINEGLRNGKYNTSLEAARRGESGNFYGI